MSESLPETAPHTTRSDRPTPTTTYRLQLRREFTFSDAAAVVPYLADLGISHVYCSPVLQAAPGSAHGYDVVDHSRLSEELGGDSGWQELVDACTAHGLGLVVDVVPNHMAAPTPERLNPPLWDVLTHGPDSAFANWLDADWDAEHGRLLLPILGQPLGAALDAGEVTVDQDAGVIRYFDHELPLAPATTTLDEQHYRLADWQTANDELNYRRFFDVTTLMGVRVEIPAVFDATHRRLLALVTPDGPVTGLRIDHPDGLADPAGYLDRLAEASGDTWTVVEKILEPGESLPGWRCAGTTGYDTLNQLTTLLVDPAGEAALTDFYVELTGMPPSIAPVVESCKRLVATRLFGAEVDRVVHELLAEPDLAGRDLTVRAVRDAVVELLVAFDVYRAYPDDEASQRRLDAAAATAREHRPDRSEAIDAVRRHGLLTRLQQTAGPVMAKGVEDTALYRWHRLDALNEVGGDPDVFSRGVEDWHAWCTGIATHWPATMTTLSTHDTKRSEDVRARLVVLSEIPAQWREAVGRWRELAARHEPVDANTDYLVWQTLVGAWPLPLDRLASYLDKATREAKQHTSWTDPDPEYDARLHRYLQRLLGDDELMTDVGSWVREHVQGPGRSNALTQKLLQLLMPGVPDIYQGNETEDFSLVDPDNRRPVDYEARRHALDGGGHPKLAVTAAAARLRRERPDLVGASYTAVPVTGAATKHAVAFLRSDDVAVVATRLPVGLGRAGGWRDTSVRLPPGTWQEQVSHRTVHTSTGGTVELARLLHALPVALLVKDAG